MSEDLGVVVPSLKLSWRRSGLHGSNLLASVHICELERPNRVLNVRRYGDFRSRNPLFRLRKVSRRDTVSIVCKRGDPARIYPYKLTVNWRLGFWR
jgi:hypothetical protein